MLGITPSVQNDQEGRQMDDTTGAVAEVLHEAAETHHIVWRIVDGDDPDWASWYSDWLISLSRLPELLGGKPVRSELTWMLVQLARDYGASGSDQRWEGWYAERIVGELSR
jgi:hypothetical protein